MSNTLPAVFRLVLTVHVLAAAVTLGATIAYAVSVWLAEREPDHLAFTIRAVRRSDRLVAIPAFLVTFITGVWITAEERLPYASLWLLVSVVLTIAIFVVGFGVWGPVVREQLDVLARGGVRDPEYPPLRSRAMWLYAATIGALTLVFYLMVAKPA